MATSWLKALDDFAQSDADHLVVVQGSPHWFTQSEIAESMEFEFALAQLCSTPPRPFRLFRLAPHSLAPADSTDELKAGLAHWLEASSTWLRLADPRVKLVAHRLIVTEPQRDEIRWMKCDDGDSTSTPDLDAEAWAGAEGRTPLMPLDYPLTLDPFDQDPSLAL